MLNDRLKAAQAVRSQLLPTKDAADETFLQFLKLGVVLCEARRDAGLPMHAVQGAFEEITRAISHSCEARSAAINAHRVFAGELDQIFPGVPRSTVTRMVGDTFPYPPAGARPETDADENGLSVVA
jgi:hypothetical protein